MTRIRTLTAKLPSIDSRSIGEIEQEIDDELDFHIAMRTEENMRRGISAAEARIGALTSFGDLEKIRQQCRRTLMGERMMWQRIQMVLSIVLLIAFAVLAAQVYSGQRDNQESLARISNSLRQLAERPANTIAGSEHGSVSVPND